MGPTQNPAPINSVPQTESPKKKQYLGLKITLASLCFTIAGLIAAIAVFAITGQDQNSGPVTRTFMIYMTGSDLESDNGAATHELSGIDPKEVDLENINVIMIAGGSKRWRNNYIDADETSIYQLTSSGFTKVKTQNLMNMGEPETLSSFLKYVTDNYKTKEYELVFWNHGGALEGSEYDQLHGDDALSLQEITEALSNTTFNKDNPINTVIFSTCLNGTIENANVFKEHARYFVASEETSWTSPTGSDFSFINDVELATKNEEIGDSFIKNYKEKMVNMRDMYNAYNVDYDIYSTYSHINLTKLDALNKAVDEFFADINVASNYSSIAKIRSNLLQYGVVESHPSTLRFDTVDLYNLVEQLKPFSPDKAQKVLDEFKNVVMYNYSTDADSRGLSIYFPFNGSNRSQEQFLSIYNEISSLKNYNKFIENFNATKLAGASNRLSFSKNHTQATTTSEGADFELVLTDEQLANFTKANYMVWRDNHDGTFRPVYKGIEVALEGNTLKAQIKDRQLVVNDAEATTDEMQEYGGGLLTLFEDEVTDSYIKYTTNVTLTDLDADTAIGIDLIAASLNLILNKETGEVSLGETTLISDGFASGTVVDLNEYDTIGFATSSYHIQNADGSFNEDWSTTSDGIITGWECEVGSCDFTIEDFDSDQDYYCVFHIKDINNNVYYSNLIKLE
ncbi:MAG: clostripain-related cysteine peptidase [Candidatus Saccharibacteria bacterium]|nr:clostripain-related cysteine peptidase [Candidatus Saccharibacteria bacterium]